MHGHGLDELAQAPFRPRHDQVQGRRRQRQEPDRLRRGAARQGARLCRRGRRLHAAPPPPAEAAAHRRPACWPSTRRSSGRCRRWWPQMEARRHQGRPRRAAAPVGGFRQAHGRARDARSTSSPATPSTSARRKQLGEVLFDELKLARRQEEQDRRLRHRRRRARGAGAEHALPARVLDWRQLAKLKAPMPTRWSAQINPRTGRVHTSYSLAGAVDRAARLDRPQPAEHPGPHRGRAARSAAPSSPSRAMCCSRPITARSSCVSPPMSPTSPALKAGLPPRATTSTPLTASEVFGVPVEGMDPPVAPPRQGDQFRHHLRHQRLRPGAAARRCPRARPRDYIKAYFAALPRHPRLHGADQGIRARAGLCRDAVRPALLHARHQGRRTRRARGFAERQAINAPLQGAAADIIKRAMRRMPPRAGQGRPRARACCSRCMTSWSSRRRRTRSTATAALVKEVMEGAASPAVELSVPLVVETGGARNWDEAH